MKMNAEMMRNVLVNVLGINEDEVNKIPNNDLKNNNIQLYAVTCSYVGDEDNSTYLHVNWSDAVAETESIALDIIQECEDDEYDYDYIINDDTKNCIYTVFDGLGEVYMTVTACKVYNLL